MCDVPCLSLPDSGKHPNKIVAILDCSFLYITPFMPGFPAGPFFFLGGGDSPPPKKNQLLPPKFILTLFLFTLSPLPLGYSLPKSFNSPPKGEILHETLYAYINYYVLKRSQKDYCYTLSCDSSIGCALWCHLDGHQVVKHENVVDRLLFPSHLISQVYGNL